MTETETPQNDEIEFTENEIESIKLWHDLFKHLTVASSAALAIIGTFWKNFSSDENHEAKFKFVLILSLAALLLAGFFSVFSHGFMLQAFPKENPKTVPFVKIGSRLAFLCFAVGIALFGIFAIGNVLSS